MGKQRDLSTGIVAQIQALRQQGLTQTKTAEQLGISQSSVCKALKKNCSKRTNCSGVRKTSARDNKQLRKIAVSNRFKSTSELTDFVNKQTGADVSRSTTYRRLRKLGFKSRVPAVKPMSLNKKQWKKRLKWAKEHVLAWPANSPDLNVIENLWAIVKRKIRDRKPTTLDQLKQNIATAWEAVSAETCDKLVKSMPRRLQAVIQAKGAATKY
uniref:Transposase Tc1-like domain-containing protein n=1 Tax=Astyanax mexicanus TaxID=7994 RepID=A0A3B1IST3_ASTMX